MDSNVLIGEHSAQRGSQVELSRPTGDHGDRFWSAGVKLQPDLTASRWGFTRFGIGHVMIIAPEAAAQCPLLPRVGRGPDNSGVAGQPVHHGAVNYETGRATCVDPSDVETRGDFARFLSAVLADFRSTGEAEWENGTLDCFLDGLSAFAGARVIDAPEHNQEQASWRLFADIVLAATGYE